MCFIILKVDNDNNSKMIRRDHIGFSFTGFSAFSYFIVYQSIFDAISYFIHYNNTLKQLDCYFKKKMYELKIVDDIVHYCLSLDRNMLKK